MMNHEFSQLMQSVVQGDKQAAAQLVQDYEPEIRRIVRFRLKDPQLRRVFDSTDICQSVFGQFFCLAELGRFDLTSPRDLINLLAKMASNRVIDRYRSEQSQRRLRQQRWHSQSETVNGYGEILDAQEFPDNEIERQELLEKIRHRMSPTVRQISELRTQGKSWLEIAQQMGESPQALRKRLERSCATIFQDLGIQVDE